MNKLKQFTASEKSPLDLPDEAEQDDWLLTFADIITLLFTFIVMLMSLATLRPERVHQVSAVIGNRVSTTTIIARQTNEALSHVENQLREIVQRQQLQNKVAIERNETLIKLQLVGNAYFAPGVAHVKVNEEPFFRELAAVFVSMRKMKISISIEGHTDSTPISSEVYESNWDLSAMRAVNILHLLASFGAPTHQMSAIAHASNKPLLPNTTTKNREQNRRIEILIKIPK